MSGESREEGFAALLTVITEANKQGDWPDFVTPHFTTGTAIYARVFRAWGRGFGPGSQIAHRLQEVLNKWFESFAGFGMGSLYLIRDSRSLSQHRVGGGVTAAVLPHHGTYGSVYGGS
jgi:hypothetical protein